MMSFGLMSAKFRTRDAALKSGLHFAGVILEALQRFHFAGEHHHVVAQNPHFAVALDEAIDHHAASHVADFADAEYFPHLGAALVDLFEHRLQHAGHGALQLVGELVNDGVQPDVDLFLLGQRGWRFFRAGR